VLPNFFLLAPGVFAFRSGDGHWFSIVINQPGRRQPHIQLFAVFGDLPQFIFTCKRIDMKLFQAIDFSFGKILLYDTFYSYHSPIDILQEHIFILN
jgi:hypothetical protein